MCFLLILPSSQVFAAAGPTLRTTLSDNTTQRGSKKTFDVWARNASGEKIKATVTFNGEKLLPTWDDNEKSSYTLNFTFEGDNTVVVSASSDGGRKKQLTYHINYEKARQGEKIGTAVWSVEMFTIGCGYLVYPQKVNIYEGETSAQQLLRLLNENGYVGYYGGSVSSSFYLAYVADGTASAARYNNYQRSSSASSPKALGISPTIPSVLVPHLKSTMTFYDPGDYEKNWKGHLGEFVITNGSGWMYSVNNVFPNVGFADTYLSDGDIVRVQFTLGYGADIGGFGAMGTSIPNVENQPKSGYFSVANKDSLTKAIERTIYSGLITRSNVKNAYAAALSVAETLDASQSAVDNAVSAINSALQNPGSETNSAPADAPLSVGGSGAHVSRCGIRRQECVGRRGSCRFRWVCRRCRGFGCGGIRFFRDRCGNGGDNRSFRGSFRERREQGKRRIIVGKQKIKNACHGNMLGIGIYRFGRRSMLYCVLCKETPQKRRKRKIC